MSIIGTAFKLAVGAPVGWWLYSRFGINHDMDLPKALDAERTTMRTAAAGPLSYYADTSGEGRPLVLIHSINAAANPQEMQPLFDHYRGTRPVYALDLPGFGFSERSERHYSPQLFADAIGEFVIHGVDEPPDVIALSLSCEFTALAATVNPDMFNSLTFISPTGLATDHRDNELPKVTITPTGTKFSMGMKRVRDAVRPEQRHAVLSNPLLAQPLFDLIVSRPSLFYFSPRSDHSLEALRDETIDYSYRTSHRPGARRVPLYFVSGALKSDDIVDTYRSLLVRTLVIHGQARYTSFEKLPELLVDNERWQAVSFDGADEMVHQDEPELTTTALEDFWAHRSNMASITSA